MSNGKLRHFSGTPVAEGVRLEVGSYTVFAVRNEKKDIAVRMRREPRQALRILLKVPLLRGIVRLFRDIFRFFDGLGESTEFKPQRIVRGNGLERVLAVLFGTDGQAVATFLSFCLLPILAFLLLYAAPEGAKLLLMQLHDFTLFQLSLLMCVVRVCAFLLAVGCAVHLKVFRRMLMYRYALNQAINCYECGDDMRTETVAQYPRYARRSEAAFLLSVGLWSIIAFGFLPVTNITVYIPLRILIVLAVAALINEPIRAIENAPCTRAIKILRTPLDLLQHMTTLKPNFPVQEVAVCAFQAALGELIDTADN